MKKLIAGLLISFLFFIAFEPVSAHPGNTAADGCHYCRTNCAKWGEVAGARHCHGNSTPTPTSTPKPVPTPITSPKPVVNSVSWTNKLQAEIIKSKTDYFMNPDGFRETKISDLVAMFPDAIASTISSNVYKMLPDVVCNANRFNCPDLVNHECAQAVYNKCMQEAGSDIHSLDADSDGLACEANK